MTSDREASAEVDEEQAPETLFAGLPVADARQREAMVWSMWDGIFTTCMIAVTETFGIAAALKLGAPAMAIAMLGSLPLFLSSIGQLLAPSLVNEQRGRRRIVVGSVATQATFLLACGAAGLMPGRLSVLWYVFAFTAAGVAGGTGAGLWMSWMRDLTDEAGRGRLFARRNRIFAFVHLGGVVLAGMLARRHTALQTPWHTYAAAFAIAAVVRFGAAFALVRQHEDRSRIPRSRGFTLAVSPEFMRYALSTALLLGAAHLGGPFFNVWFLRDLRFDYQTFSIGAASSVIGTIVALPIWGRIADQHGSFRLMRLCAVLGALVPLPYLVWEQPAAIWICNFFGGAAWSGFNLGNFNYLLQAAGHSRTDQHISFAVAITGMSIFLFGLLGGYLAPRLPELFGWQLRSLFFISFCLRLFVATVVFSMLRPLAPQPGGPSAFEVFFSVPGYRTGMGVLRNAFRAFRRQ